MHLPISLDDTLHFYQYLKEHILTADGQFLYLIDIPTQDSAQHTKYMKFSTYQSHIEKYQLSTKSVTTT